LASRKSLYPTLQQTLKKGFLKQSALEGEHLHRVIRKIRTDKGLRSVEVCRRANDLDPKTLTAVEKGRIRNPSIKTLSSISRGLGVTIADLFRETELSFQRNLYTGNQKGAFQIDFPKQGARIISFTPFIKDFFCGKLILNAQRKMDDTVLTHPLPFYIGTLIGRFEVAVDGKTFQLKEGENLFFNGLYKHSIYNPLHRDSVLMLVTAPSFVG